MNRSLAGIMSLLFCVGIFAFIYVQHQILVKEVESIEKSAMPVPGTVVEDLNQESKPVNRGIAYKIDPTNDPLAPVSKKKSVPASKAPSSSPSASQRPVYELPMDSPVLAQ